MTFHASFSSGDGSKDADPSQHKPSSSVRKQLAESESSKVTDQPQPISFVDEIRQAAESIQNENGFVYEPTSGLYYDRATGYYYNAVCRIECWIWLCDGNITFIALQEHGLYYDGNTGCYYKFNVEENKFEFHSQVATAVTTNQVSQRSKINRSNAI